MLMSHIRTASLSALVFCAIATGACAQKKEATAYVPTPFKPYSAADLANFVKPSEAELRGRLNDLQYEVTQE